MIDTSHKSEFEHIIETDLSFEIWREIFRAIVENEKKALLTGETVELTLDLTQGVANTEAPVFRIEVVCSPNAPARFRRVA